MNNIQHYNLTYLVGVLTKVFPGSIVDIQDRLVGLVVAEGRLNHRKCYNIDNAFSWHGTPQGHEYWTAVHSKSRDAFVKAKANYDPPLPNDVEIGWHSEALTDDERPLI